MAAPLCNSRSWPEAVNQPPLLPPSRLITCMPACMCRPMSETSMAAAGVHTLTAPSLARGAPAFHNEKFVVSEFVSIGYNPSITSSCACSASCTHAQPVIAQLVEAAKQAPHKPPDLTKNTALTTCPCALLPVDDGGRGEHYTVPVPPGHHGGPGTTYGAGQEGGAEGAAAAVGGRAPQPTVRGKARAWMRRVRVGEGGVWKG